MPDNNNKLPPCGLYRTSVALAANPELVPAGRLVMFHNHSDQNMPFVQLPEKNVNNIWKFTENGPGIESPEFIEGLQPLLPQGIYYLKKGIKTHDEVQPAFSIVQLGYTPEAEPIIFMGSFENGVIVFPQQGYKFYDPSIFEHLQPLRTKGDIGGIVSFH